MTLDVKFGDLGLAVGNSFQFDVYTSGGGGTDSAIDALANPSQSVSDWGNAYNSGALVDTYTLTSVPEPASCVLLGLGACFSARGHVVALVVTIPGNPIEERFRAMVDECLEVLGTRSQTPTPSIALSRPDAGLCA